MFTYVFISLWVLKTALCQINGEFWWLNDKVTQIHNFAPAQPTIEDISSFETDESVRVIFKDNELDSREIPANIINNDVFLDKDKTLPYIAFLENRTNLPTSDVTKIEIVKNIDANISIDKASAKTSPIFFPRKDDTVSSFASTNKENKDEFKFIFPDNVKQLWENKIKNYTNTNNSEVSTINENNKIYKSNNTIQSEKTWFEEDKTFTETESICTFIVPRECFSRNGFIHQSGTCLKNIYSDTRKVCCVLPLINRSSRPKIPKLLFKRNKRSNPGDLVSTALKQRNALLLQKYNSNGQLTKSSTTSSPTNSVQNIVTPGDYFDPYWNIKNAKFRNPNQQTIVDKGTQYDGSQDYSESYDVELPKPGLVGLYSDHEDRVTSWKLKTNKRFSYGDTYESYEDSSEEGFGYSTIDPRLGNRKPTTASRPSRRRPQRIKTPAINENAVKTLESQTVHFNSNPDFRVLEGFKLVNLGENRNRHTKRTTTKPSYPSDEEILFESTSPVIISSDFDYGDAIDMKQQVFKNCGKYKIKPTNDANLGPETRCEPWLAVVVLTKNPQKVLCYATIIHPRAAVTAANCIHGKATGDITTLAGVWDLNERSKSQQRMSSIHIHPQFSIDDLANDLAILHWKRPLRMQANVLPACLADPHVGDDCYFVGWGGYDQEFRQLPKWQHATIMTPRTCNEKLSAPDFDLPAGAFCASVSTRGTVTGVGGPLLCKAGDRVSMVGVAVYRDDVVILLPAYEWIANTLRELQIYS